MDHLKFWVLVIIIWIICTVLHNFCRTYSQTYANLVQQRNIILKPFYVKVYLANFPRWFLKLPLKHKDFFHRWFDVGYIVTCCLLVPSMALLAFSAFRLCMPDKKDEPQTQIIQPVVPGYNLPLSMIWHYLSALVLCTIVHEAGHALAALKEGIDVDGYGMLVMVGIPAAYVDLRKDQLYSLMTLQRLRIFCAGVWHNILLTAFALLLLVLLPVLTSFCFIKGTGVSVINVDENSGLMNPKGLFVGDKIVKVNDCEVRSIEQWKGCLRKVAYVAQVGSCSSELFVNKEQLNTNTNRPNCCPDTLSHLCFKYWKPFTEIDSFSCLPARKVLKDGSMCQINSDCRTEKNICIVPHFNSNSTRLAVIQRQIGEDVLYFGSMAELYRHVDVVSWNSKCYFVSVTMIDTFETFLKFIIAFSSALAILNVVPCPGLDGIYIWETVLVRYFSAQLKTATYKKYLLNVLKVIGISLIGINVCLGIMKIP